MRSEYKNDNNFKFLEGKTVKHVTKIQRYYDYEEPSLVLIITFTDESSVEIETFDLDGYPSTMEIILNECE